MPSAPINRLEFSFQPVNLITEIITDSSSGEAHTLSADEGEEEMPTFFVMR